MSNWISVKDRLPDNEEFYLTYLFDGHLDTWEMQIKWWDKKHGFLPWDLIDDVTHGFRSLFSTSANESQLFSDDVIERCLAHVPRNKIRPAYNRAEYWQHRVELMQWWADIVED